MKVNLPKLNEVSQRAREQDNSYRIHYPEATNEALSFPIVAQQTVGEPSTALPTVKIRPPDWTKSRTFSLSFNLDV